ncbi:MAG: EAL domain-containing protein [Pseudomonadales bacterium]|nr:EAL domain-containing protein [Pseudomonadales bacterium]
MSQISEINYHAPQLAYARLLDKKMRPDHSLDADPKNARLLLVDDKPELLDSLYEVVVSQGYQVAKALGGQAALDYLSCEEFDVVLLDLIMPDIGGQDVLNYIAQNKISTKVIVVSGDASFSGVKNALTHGAFDFVRKPYEAAELLATVQKALEHYRLEQQNLHMENQLRESEELYRFIVHSSPDLVYMLDRNGCFTFLNDRVDSLLGYSQEELIGKHYSEIIAEEDLDAARFLFNDRRVGRRATRNAEVKLRCLRASGTSNLRKSREVWTELTAKGIYQDEEERTRESFMGTYGTARDISERKEAQELIDFQAYHDLLTRLPNRALLNDRLSLAITQAERNKRNLAVMFLDLDRFKLVNDTLGHSMGDRLLKAVSNRLQSCLRGGDTLSRIGGDEFALLLPEVRTRDDVVVIAEKILDRLSTPFVIDGHELYVGASIGIAMYPEAGDSVESLIQNADIAMYHIKGRGKNGFQFFSDEMNSKFSTRLSLERELRTAISNNELRVFYQPQVDLSDGSIIGVEALMRWQHPERGLILPGEFLGVAEEAGFLTQLDFWVQSHAFNEIASWRESGLGDIRLSVNMASNQMEKDSFVETFLESLYASGLPPERLKIEITENTIMHEMEIIVPKLKTLREKGIHIAIDDFGTGYSSLSYLQQFPVDTLKIDRSFVSDIRADQGDANIINAIVAMARGLKFDLIAEGVETRMQLRYLRSQGCSEVQGFIFSQPVPSDELIVMLQDKPFEELVRKEAQQQELANAGL